MRFIDIYDAIADTLIPDAVVEPLLKVMDKMQKKTALPSESEEEEDAATMLGKLCADYFRETGA